jgi:hypothetical protein
LEKIENNDALDDFDRDFPHYEIYADILIPHCKQAKTDTAKEVLALLP